MKQAHINITIIIVVIILIIAGFRVYKNKQKSKEEAQRKKNDVGSGADYNKDKQADATKLLDDTTLKADVQKLVEYSTPYFKAGGIDNNMSAVLSVAHSIDNQAQWAQILNEYAKEFGSDLYTDIKEAMTSFVPFVPPYEKEREENIQKIKAFINTLPTGQ